MTSITSMRCMDILLLYVLIGTLVVEVKPGEVTENIAVGKPTRLTSTESDNGPELAIDGDPNTFAMSEVQTTPTWRIDLLSVYRVAAVNITNRNDCCADKLNGAYINIGVTNSGMPNCAVVSEIPLGETSTYNCNGMEGQYVSVFVIGDGKQLALAEVQVFGELKDPPTPTPSPPITFLFSGRTMVLVREQLSWFKALLHCRNLYRDLASLRSPEEQLEVGQALLLHGAQTAHVWLGLRRRMLSGEWYWMNGEEMDHSNWEGREAQYHEVQRISSCGAAANMGEFHWSHRPCMEQLNFLCYTDDAPDYSPVQLTFYVNA